MTKENVILVFGFIILGATLGWIFFGPHKNAKQIKNGRAAGVLRRFAGMRKYKVLDNVTLEGKNGWAHVDYILVGWFGVLFVTVLGDVGSYYGDADDENWTIVTAENVRNRIPNPLRAGEGAMDALRGVLVKNNVYNIPMEQLVVVLPKFNDKREFCIKQSLPVINVRKLSARLSTSHFEEDKGVDVEKLAALIAEAAEKE